MRLARLVCASRKIYTEVPASLRKAFCVVATSVWLLSPSCAWAGPYATPLERASLWLESQQAVSDGSWRDASEAKTYLQTSEAVLALHAANLRRTAYYAGQTWIENHDPKNLDARARRLMVLRATQSSAQQDIDALLAAISNPAAGQAGWGLAKRYKASPLDTALVIDALRTAGATFDSAQPIAYLKAAQLTAANNRGWSIGAGTTTDAYTTARVVQALAAFRASDPSLATPLANAVATLRLIVGTAAPAHVRAAAVLAYLRMDAASADAPALLNSLLANQRPDGGFDAGILATGLIAQSFALAEGADATNNRTRVDMVDAALRTAINEALGRGALDQLNRGELGQLRTLDISGRGITSLQGLQYAVNLTTLNGANNNISDTTPLAGLTRLTNVDLAGNPCSGCGGPGSQADVPLPAWALLLLGGWLLGAIGLKSRRSGS